MDSKEQNDESVFSIREDELEEIRKHAFEKAERNHHVWKQKGSWIVCKSCSMGHGFYVKPHQRLMGTTEDGKPILKNVNI